MSVLIVSPFRYADTGGVCTAVRMLRREFETAGSRVFVLTPGESDWISRINPAHDRGVCGMYLRVPFIRESKIKGLVAFFLFFPLTVLSLWLFVQRERVTAIGIQYPGPQFIYFAILRCLASFRLVVTFQGNDVHDIPMAGRTDRLLLRCLLRKADAITAVSKSLLDELNKSLPGLTVPQLVIRNGAPAQFFANQASVVRSDKKLPQTYVLAVGQLIYRKGMDILIRALGLARDRGCSIDLVVVGEGDERSNLQRLVDELGLMSNVCFVGNQPHEKINRFFKHCLFFVLSSRAEGLPIVIVEAMASGKAVIAAAVDGVSELVDDGFTGLLVKAEDPESLAVAMLKLIQDVELRNNLAIRGFEKMMRDYDWRTIAAKYLSVYMPQPYQVSSACSRCLT